MKKFLLKIDLVILICISYFSGYAAPKDIYLQNFADKDSTISFSQNKVYTFTPLQLLVGEVRLSLEKQTAEKKYDIYGTGLIYYMANDYLIPVLSDYYYGINLFYGKKTFFNRHFYWSKILFLKYEYDKHLMYDCSYDVFMFIPCSGNNDCTIVNRQKFLLGGKILFGYQTLQKHKIISNLYLGLGVRLRYLKYSKPVEKTGMYLWDGFVIPSIHLGYSIGYNSGKKK